MSTIVFTPPGKDEPGFLRRMRTALSFQKKLSENPTVEAMDEMIEFLLDYISEPEDRTEARAMLLEVSEQQFFELLNSVGGSQGDENPT